MTEIPRQLNSVKFCADLFPFPRKRFFFKAKYCLKSHLIVERECEKFLQLRLGVLIKAA